MPYWESLQDVPGIFNNAISQKQMIKIYLPHKRQKTKSIGRFCPFLLIGTYFLIFNEHQWG